MAKISKEVQQKLEQLKIHDHASQKIRDELKIHKLGEALWYKQIDFQTVVVVEANGYGGASLFVGKGIYPITFNADEVWRYELEQYGVEDAKERYDDTEEIKVCSKVEDETIELKDHQKSTKTKTKKVKVKTKKVIDEPLFDDNFDEPTVKKRKSKKSDFGF